MYDLSGKIALITGAGGEHGIGRAICQRLAQEGWGGLYELKLR